MIWYIRPPDLYTGNVIIEWNKVCAIVKSTSILLVLLLKFLVSLRYIVFHFKCKYLMLKWYLHFVFNYQNFREQSIVITFYFQNTEFKDWSKKMVFESSILFHWRNMSRKHYTHVIYFQKRKVMSFLYMTKMCKFFLTHILDMTGQ